MPVDLQHSRFSSHAPRAPLSPWDCPACGLRNEGRKPEQGCVHCGAGDPSKSTAGGQEKSKQGQPAPQEQAVHRPAALASAQGSHALPGGSRSPGAPPVVAEAAGRRILRLIEYIIAPGQNADVVLRRSLVGRVEMGWGSITGTIVDSIDANQEDRLRLARMQPGVWLSNEMAMNGELWPAAPRPAMVLHRPDIGRSSFKESNMDNTSAPPAAPTMPDTGPAYSADQDALARRLLELVGERVAHTLSLALSSIAEELGENSEPWKFLDRDECLQLANALLQAIPTAWLDGGPPPEPTVPAEGGA